MAQYYAGELTNGAGFEAATIGELNDKIVAYYIDGYEPDCTPTPTYKTVTLYANEEEVELDAGELNDDLADAWNDAVECASGPSDYEEHNTHWKGCAL